MEFDNELIVRDKMTGKEYTFFYRTPTLDEWIEHSRDIKKTAPKEEGKGTDDLFEALYRNQIEWAGSLIEGIKEENFGFSSDPESPVYREDWKDRLVKKFYYLLPAVSNDAFRVGEAVQKN